MSAFSRSPRRAFTMIELVVVMIIIALIASMAVPRFANTLAQNRLDAAAARVISDLDMARRVARLGGRAVTVTFDVANDAYELQNIADLDSASEPYDVALNEPPYDVAITAVDFDGASEVAFDTFGAAATGGTVTIALGGVTRVITLDATSGKATVP